MIFATIISIFMAFLLLKKRKVKEFFLFLGILFIITFPSLETFIEQNIHLPIKNLFNYNSEATRTFINSLPSLLKLFYLFSSITITYFAFEFLFSLFLNQTSNRNFIHIANSNFAFFNKKLKNLFLFDKPNMKLTA